MTSMPALNSRQLILVRSTYTASTDLDGYLSPATGSQPEEPKYHPARTGLALPNPKPDSTAMGALLITWQSPNANGSTQYTFGASFPATYIPDSAIVRTTIFDLLIGAVAAFFGAISTILPFCCFGGFFFGLPIWGVINERKRKLQYIKPSISIEGHGIKRGLTAVEAAILMGQPLDKVMTMMLLAPLKRALCR